MTFDKFTIKAQEAVQDRCEHSAEKWSANHRTGASSQWYHREGT